MASKSLHFCTHANCNALTTERYCVTHAPMHTAGREYDRGSSAERGYDAQWRIAREAYLRTHPLCERCLAKGEVEAATMVHHKVALRDGGARLDPRNFMALSDNCHAIVEGRKIEVLI